ncbi:MAG: hypothetical protein ACFFDN_17195 [Candidatus Hodarchaeota archaeon]
MSEPFSAKFMDKIKKMIDKNNELLYEVEMNLIENPNSELLEKAKDQLADNISVELLNKIKDFLKNDSVREVELTIDAYWRLFLKKRVVEDLSLEKRSTVLALFNDDFLLIPRQSDKKKKMLHER